MSYISAPAPDILCVTTRLHAAVCGAIEHTVKVMRNEHTADVYLPWTYKNAQALALLGAPAASPIMRDYSYPKLYGKYAPYEHQEQIAEFLTLHNRCYCFGGMGVGKTAAAIWATEYLFSIGEIKKVLIVCTKTTMSPAWGDTLFMLAPSRSYTLLRGTRQKRFDLCKEDTAYHIINHDGIKTCTKELLANQYDLIIVDESTAFKTATSDRWKHMNYLTKQANRTWLLTGSPTPKSPEDAYGQVKLVDPTKVPAFFTAWRGMVMQQVSMYKWEAKPNAKEIVFNAMQPAIHIRKEDVLKNQPPTFKVLREVEITSEQNKLITSLRKQEIVRTKNGGTVTPVHAAATLTKYMQIMLGAVYDDDGNVADIDNTSRIEAVISLIEEGRASGIGEWDAPLGKSIVAVPYRHVLEQYLVVLTKAGYKVGVIHGGVSGTARDNVIRAFQNTQDIEVLLVIPDAIAHGVTLTAANTFIWCSPLVKPEIFQQANERMDRPGQTQVMTQARLYGSSLERKYYTVMDNRVDWQSGLLSMYNEIINSI